MFYMSFLNFSDEVASKLTFSEKLNQILTTGIGGYILVFAILALIWFILALFGKVFDRKPKIKKVETVTAPKTEAISPTPAPVEQDDKAIVAAIVAAISAYEGKPTSSFKVVSFRKKH